MNAAVDEAFPGLRDRFGATLQEHESEPPPPDPADDAGLDRVRRQVLALLRDVGRFQTGRPVDTAWALDAARSIAREVLGVVDWHLTTEANPQALRAVLARAEREWEATRPRDTDDDIPF